MDAQYFAEKTAEISRRIDGFLGDGLKLFVGSSFQTHSIPLLHIITSISKEIPVYFIDTGFHFPETLIYRDQIAELFGIEVINTRSVVCKSLQCDGDGNLYFASDPDHCCYLNKIQPLEPILIEKDVWINGIRADQSAQRKAMKPVIEGPFNTLRYHPMLHWTNKDIFYYRKLHNLPPHPLEEKGYLSIGCEPCTRKADPSGGERQGRWFGMKKTECGLHTDLVAKK
ncbi:Phosphoadenylyl-sulfate reductase [thioredoxin] [hydrothermal vent metagenome]|uniref:Phosphoadenylyl-sulfate reductase [thioredoxin] n=1 Tax=hydrothermal vent metagenome TaxID=652676 RepID=A0A3B1B486_9ZZZZ